MAKSQFSKSMPPEALHSARRLPRFIAILLITLAIVLTVGSVAWRVKSRSSANVTNASAGPAASVATPVQSMAAPSSPVSSPAAANRNFELTAENKGPAPANAPAGMVWIPGGEFSMGAQEAPSLNEVGMQATKDSRPIHRVYVDGFWMDKNDVTNTQFARFVKSTGYVTVAEKKPRAEDFPGAPPENLVAGAVIFSPRITWFR